MDGSYSWDYSLVRLLGAFHFQEAGLTLPCSTLWPTDSEEWRGNSNCICCSYNETALVGLGLSGSTLHAATLGSFSWAGVAGLGEWSRPRV